MKQLIVLFIFFTCIASSLAQEITGSQLLEKAIQYHDPNGKWETFKGTFFITMKTPNRPIRNSEIKIDLPNQFFSVKASQAKNTTEYTVDKGKCSIAFNGDTNPSEELIKKHKITCERAKMYKNYYTYLYGLPMKLKDSGTIIHQQVNLDKFRGEMYFTLKVTYQKEVGKDTWYFYFNPETYAMEAYQFYHDEKKNDGEFILLTDFETINGIKIPKKRDWFYNKNEQFLGTDILKKKL